MASTINRHLRINCCQFISLLVLTFYSNLDTFVLFQIAKVHSAHCTMHITHFLYLIYIFIDIVVVLMVSDGEIIIVKRNKTFQIYWALIYFKFNCLYKLYCLTLILFTTVCQEIVYSIFQLLSFNNLLTKR